MTKMYKMECGCEFPILDEIVDKNTGLPALDIDYYNLRLDCDIAWDVFTKSSKGVFQLETNLGNSYSKKLKPENIEDLAALGALLRPGCLKSILDGKSLTLHFIDRKNKLEEATPLDKSIEDILQDTYQVMTYQEQTLRIAQKVAGFDLKQADVLRRAIGKKIPELMTAVEKDFIAGVKKVGIITEEKGREIWEAIRKSERYSFNKSHSVSYAILGYISAYIKSHFPLLFYTAWLSNAKNKLDGKGEIKELIRDAKQFDIKVNNPSILHLSSDFVIYDKEVFFGISNIKGIGESQYIKLENIIKDYCKDKKVENISFESWLLDVFPKLSKTIVTNLILVGGFNHLNRPRREMIYFYNLISQLTDKELEKVKNANSELSLVDKIKSIKVIKSREKIINSIIFGMENPSSELEDNLVWINKVEEDLLGIPITVSKLDTCDFFDADTTCREFLDGKSGNVKINGEIIESKEITTKGNNPGQKMAFLSIEDESGVLDNITVFPNIWDEYKNVLYKGNTILVHGYKSKKNSLILQKATQI